MLAVLDKTNGVIRSQLARTVASFHDGVCDPTLQIPQKPDGIHTAGNKKMTLLGFILREDAALVTDGPSDREPIHHTRLKLVQEGKRLVTVA